MKSFRSSFFTSLISFTVFVALTLFCYVFFVEQIKSLKREKVNKEELLIERKNKLSEYIVEVQKLSSEERITRIAEEKLGLLRSSTTFDVIKINEEQVNRIEKAVNKLYD